MTIEILFRNIYHMFLFQTLYMSQSSTRCTISQQLSHYTSNKRDNNGKVFCTLSRYHAGTSILGSNALFSRYSKYWNLFSNRKNTFSQLEVSSVWALVIPHQQKRKVAAFLHEKDLSSLYTKWHL